MITYYSVNNTNKISFNIKVYFDRIMGTIAGDYKGSNRELFLLIKKRIEDIEEYR